MRGEWLDPVAEALDARSEPVRIFVRDDDGGWDDARLMALLEVCAARDVAVDVAMIPTETGPPLARALTVRAAGMRLGLHQHGYAHSNHESAGRKCEFGRSRTMAQIDADVAAGRELLLERFGESLDPVFTPPWNRCVPELAVALCRRGIRVLSRDLSAGTLGHAGLHEVPVRIDWFGGLRGRRWSRLERGRAIADAIASDDPVVGLMLHHSVTGPGELADVDALFALLGNHAGARMVSIMEVLRERDRTPRGPLAQRAETEVTKAESAIRR